MELAKSKESTECPSDDGSSLDPGRGGPSSNRIVDSVVDLRSEQIIEHAWMLKTGMRWIRNDRNALNAFRWFVWDRLGIGDPPSRVERTTSAEGDG